MDVVGGARRATPQDAVTLMRMAHVMKLRSLLLVAGLALVAGPALADEIHGTIADNLAAVTDLDITQKYALPRAVGYAPENIPASALSPIPPNTEQLKHAYGLGEASVDACCAVPFPEDAKGRATHDVRRRTAWHRRHAFD